MAVIQNKWHEKQWRDPKSYRKDVAPSVRVDEDSTPLLKKSDAPDLEIKWNRANRIKTLRGIRR